MGPNGVAWGRKLESPPCQPSSSPASGHLVKLPGNGVKADQRKARCLPGGGGALGIVLFQRMEDVGRQDEFTGRKLSRG